MSEDFLGGKDTKWIACYNGSNEIIERADTKEELEQKIQDYENIEDLTISKVIDEKMYGFFF